MNLEVLKSSADSLTPEDGLFVIDSIRATISDRLIDAVDDARQQMEDFSDSPYRVSYSSPRLQPRFGEYVLPLTRSDALTLLTRRGMSLEQAEIEWESMVFPERDYRPGNQAYNHRTGESNPSQTTDIYPVHLLYADYREFKDRKMDKVRNYLQPYIEPESAVVDVCSLKSYLAWLADRDDMFEIILKQHFQEKDRQLWADIISDIEAIMGFELPVAEEHFNYYDNGSGFLFWQETGRLAVAALLESARKSGPPVKNYEIEAASHPCPQYPLEITPGIYYVPEGIELDTLPGEKYLNVFDFRNAAVDIRRNFGVGTATFTSIWVKVVNDYPDNFYGERYLWHAKSNTPGWHYEGVFVDASEVMRVYLDILGGQKPGGIGVVGIDIIRQVLTDIGFLSEKMQTIGSGKPANYDPADDIEINLDDPDLK